MARQRDGVGQPARRQRRHGACGVDCKRRDGAVRAVWDEGDSLWHVSELERFKSLLRFHSELLSYEEQQILHVIRTMTVYDPNCSTTLGFADKDKKLNEWAVERCWVEIKAYAHDGTEEAKSALESKMYRELSPDY